MGFLVEVFPYLLVFSGSLFILKSGILSYDRKLHLSRALNRYKRNNGVLGGWGEVPSSRVRLVKFREPLDGSLDNFNVRYLGCVSWGGQIVQRRVSPLEGESLVIKCSRSRVRKNGFGVSKFIFTPFVKLHFQPGTPSLSGAGCPQTVSPLSPPCLSLTLQPSSRTDERPSLGWTHKGRFDWEGRYYSWANF